jgi:hypothetical protein
MSTMIGTWSDRLVATCVVPTVTAMPLVQSFGTNDVIDVKRLLELSLVVKGWLGKRIRVPAGCGVGADESMRCELDDRVCMPTGVGGVDEMGAFRSPARTTGPTIHGSTSATTRAVCAA